MIYILRILGGAKWYAWLLVARSPSGIFRAVIFRLLGGRLNRGSRICYGVECRGIARISMGSYSIVGTNSVLDGRGGLKIGNNVNISSEVMIWSMKHDHSNAHFESIAAPVSIEDYVWVGPRAMIMPGVTIGNAAVICGGAIVTHSVAAGSIVAGIPARTIGIRNSMQSYQLDTNHPFF